jgi:hypothetical protein
MSLHIIGPAFSDKKIPIPVGRSFTYAIEGTHSASDIVYLNYFNGSDWISFKTFTADELGNMALNIGQSFNYGCVNEIQVKIETPTGDSNMRLIVNVIPIERQIM